MPEGRQITTLDELMKVRQNFDPKQNQVTCPAITDFKAARHARDITALPGEVIWRILKAGLYTYNANENPTQDDKG